MIADALQRRLDRMRAVSRQRWILVTVAFVTAVAASETANLAAPDGSILLVVLVAGFALTAVVEPDAHHATWAVALVVVQWALEVDDVTTAAAVVAAVLLFVFHSLVALMALAPANVTLQPAVIRRWAERSAAVVGGTLAMWGLVVAFDRWRVPGGAALTLGGFAVLAIGAVALVVRSYR